MKKLSLVFLVALLVVSLFSCNKKDDDVTVPKTYANAISGEFIAQEGDVLLKSADLSVGGHWFDVFDQKVGSTDWTRVNGTEFLPGSAAALDWASFTSALWFNVSQPVYITYCPTLPLRVVLKTAKDNVSPVSYLGIWTGTPSQNSFPISVVCRRLGDKITLNTDALTKLPGYTNMSFDVIYNANLIDVDATALASPATGSNWPVYQYTGSPIPTTKTLPKVLNAGDQEVYDGFEYKLTGDVNGKIAIVIHVDNTTITKYVDAAAMGHGLKITLNTTRVGWYNSGTIGISDQDISADVVSVDVN